LSKAEQKMTVVRYQSCYTNSTEGTICGSIWKHQQPATAFLHDPKNQDSGETLRMLQKLHQQ